MVQTHVQNKGVIIKCPCFNDNEHDIGIVILHGGKGATNCLTCLFS